VLHLLPLALILTSPALASDGIINGDDAGEDDYPQTGGMLAGAVIEWGSASFDMKMFMCSSTLIAPDVVLLAAHCVDYSYYEEMAGMDLSDAEQVFSRQADLTEWDGSQPGIDWPSDAVFAWEAVSHPDFNMESMQVGLSENSDIALLFLEEAILDVEPAILLQPDEFDQLTEGINVEVVGWGQQTASQQPPPGTVMIKQQGESFIAELSDHEFQVGLEEDDVRKCHGDSGGPSFMRVAGGGVTDMRIIGVTSHAYDMSDCNETGGVDTRIDYYWDWIDDEMRARCEDGTRVWCDQEGIVDASGVGGGPSDFDDDGETKIIGCGCATGGSPAGFGLLVLTLLAIMTRRGESRSGR